MDDEILKTVESMLGKNVEIVDCEKVSSVREEEILLINGIPIQLEGADGLAIKTALLTGEVPPCDLLNQLLFRAGIMRQPVQLETSLSVRTTLVTTEEVTVARDGRIIDERSTETKEDSYYTSSTAEVWEPVKIVATADMQQQQQNVNERISSPTPLITTPSEDDLRFRQQQQNHRNSTLSSASSENSNYSWRPPSQMSNINDSVLQSVTPPPPPPSSSSATTRSASAPVMRATNATGATNATTKTTISPCTLRPEHRTSVSCDSGHDDIFSSLENHLTGATTQNSISSCCDLSADETDFVHTPPPPLKITNIVKFATPPLSPSTRTSSDKQQQQQQPQRSVVYVRVKPQRKMPTKFGTLDEQVDHNQQQHSRKESTEHGSNVSSSDTTNGSAITDDHSLVYRDGHLISGSLSTMIQHMVPTADYYPDKSYLFAFLLSARLFIRPHELLERVCHICDIQQELPATLCSSSTTSTSTAGAQVSTALQQQSWCRFAAHFVRLLTEWIETFPYDFRDERLMQHVRTMTQKCINIDAMLRKDVSAMLQDLLHRLTVLDHYEEYLGRISCIVEAKDERLIASSSSSGITVQSTGGSSSGSSSAAMVNALSASSSLSIGGQSAGDITELCPSSIHLAHQLTHIELERLSHIGPEEFVQAFAKENPQLETSINDMKKTRNLESYVQWFNRLSYLVATEIVKHTKKKQRIRVVEYWIETAKESFNIGNFNSLMAIIAGLNMSPISRLKKTWAKVQSAQFSVLEHQMDPTSNFNSYRSTLKAAMWRSAGATDERQRIVIPFFSLLVKDLYFLNEGCSNKLPNGHINFDKFWQLAKQVTEFIGWKQVTCTFDKQSKVTMFLQTNHVLNENTLAMASFECEPPDNAHEKDRYKALKAEYYSNSQPTASGSNDK